MQVNNVFRFSRNAIVIVRFSEMWFICSVFKQPGVLFVPDVPDVYVMFYQFLSYYLVPRFELRFYVLGRIRSLCAYLRYYRKQKEASA